MNRAEIWLRTQARKLGLLRLLRPSFGLEARLLASYFEGARPRYLAIGFDDLWSLMLTASAPEYTLLATKREDYRLMRALRAHLPVGGTFWDIGANIGFYSVLAARHVGPSGRVVAFEPEPSSRARLGENVAFNRFDGRVTVVPAALGAAPGQLELEAASAAVAGTHRLVADSRAPSLDGGRVVVDVLRGDDVLARGDVPAPNAIKIDVEGAELDVLAGLGQVLANPACQAVLVEVHFALLDARGKTYGAKDVEARLATAGLSNQRWLDRSHLLASRR